MSELAHAGRPRLAPAAGDDRRGPTRAKRRKIVLLRGALVVALGGVVIDAGAGTAPPSLGLLVSLALSDAALAFAPLRWVGSPRFELTVGAVDLLAIGGVLCLVPGAAIPLIVSASMMALVVALGRERAHTVAAAAAVGAMHSWFVGGGAIGLEHLGVQVGFLCCVALYYGVLTDGVNRVRRKVQAEQWERRELSTLLEILDTITSSLDMKEVTRAIVGKLTDVVPAVRCSILLLDDSMQRACVLASHDDPEIDMLEIDLAKYPEVRSAIRSRSSVVVRDVLKDPLMSEVRGSLQELDLQSVMVIPLTFGQEMLGTLLLKASRADQEFTEREVHFCTAVARASTNALKHSLLHAQVRQEAGRHRKTSEKLASILDHSPDPILTTDDEGRITEFSKGAERLLGYRKEEILGEPCSRLFCDGCDPGLVERVLSRRGATHRACRLRRNDGSEVHAELNMAVLENDGEVTGTVWVGRDVSDLRTKELQLIQAEKLSAIGEVISGVAHELNNPLSGVLGYAQLLMAKGGNEAIAKHLEKINESALRCQRIVKNLLAFARRHKPERAHLGVNGIIEKTLELKNYHLRVHGVEVVKELDSELPRTMLDFHQIQQVFLNLITNAQHAMASVSDRPRRLVVRTSHSDGRIRVEFEDSGHGIDPKILERIFDPFFTTKGQGRGTGLGLSVSYGIVREHGGRIHAHGRKGEGATFVVELPVLRGEVSERLDASDEAEESTAGSPGARILVADDEPVILDLMVEVLKERGHRVDTASSGNEASRKLEGGDYDLVITDVRMPEMNGMDLYQKMLRSRPELKDRIIFITGDLLDHETAQFLAEVDVPTLSKPLEIRSLLSTIGDRLAGARCLHAS